MQEDEITINGRLLLDILRRRWPIWTFLGLASLGLLVFLELLLVPQTYTSSVSVAMQQSAGASSPLAMLAGSSDSKRYIGVLKSRRSADEVLHLLAVDPKHPVDLPRLCHCATRADAETLLMNTVKPEENADGLLYINVTLVGPPRLAPQTAARRQQIKDAAAQTANAYATTLRDYYVNTDNDRDTALLRGANDQVREYRAEYDAAVDNALEFSRGLRGALPTPGTSSVRSSESLGDAPGTGAGVTGGVGGTSGAAVGSLYDQLARVQQDIRAGEAAEQASQQARLRQLQGLGGLSSEDPLLTQARDQVSRDQADLAAANRLYGPDNPRLLAAQSKLQVDQAALARQVAGAKQRLATPEVRTDADLKALYARQGVLLQQVARARSQQKVSNRLSGEYDRLKAEVSLQLAVLQEAMTDAAKVRASTVSSQSRMTVIDPAIPAKFSQPRTLIMVAQGLFLVLLGILVALVREYLKRARQIAAAAPPKVGGNGAAVNGAGHVSGTGLDEKREEVGSAAKSVKPRV